MDGSGGENGMVVRDDEFEATLGFLGNVVGEVSNSDGVVRYLGDLDHLLLHIQGLAAVVCA